jgi:hypothetical protein
VTFEDATVVRVAGAGTVAGVFDQNALEQFLSCTFDREAMGPFHRRPGRAIVEPR